MKKAKGTFWMRFSILLMAILFGVLVYWSVGFLLNDIAVVGSLAGGGDLGDVDLVYVPEPSAFLLLLVAIVSLTAFRHQR